MNNTRVNMSRVSKARVIRLATVLLGACLLAQPLLAQERNRRGEEEAPTNTIDQRTGEALNAAIEFLNADQYEQARTALVDLRMDRLSPYERGRVEQIMATIEYSQGNIDQSRIHMQAALDSGGLNEVEQSQVRYQIAQMYVAEENWTAATEALEAWIATATAPNSAAYYLLAASYYQLEDFERSLPNAQKAVELTDMPQEAWLQMLQALLLQKEDYPAAEKVLKQSINLYPDKKVYWLQLSSVYATMEDYPNSLSVLQLANLAGLLTEDADFRRLADLMMAQNTPVRAAELLTAKLEEGVVKADQKFYESLANAWVASREYRKALPVLAQAAESSDDGNLYVRLGEVNMQLEEWSAAATAFTQALDKGEVRDEEAVQLLLGIVLYNQGEFSEAVTWLERARRGDSQARTASAYLQLIQSREG